MNRGTLAALLLVGAVANTSSAQRTQIGSYSAKQATYETQPYVGPALAGPGPSVWEGPPCPPANSMGGLFDGAGVNCGGYSGIVGGVGMMFLKPHWDNNPAFTAGPGPADNNQIRNFDFNYDYEYAPFAWLGYVNDSGFGVRGRWFMFDHSADVTQGVPGGFVAPPIVAGGPGGLLTNVGLPATWDIHSDLKLNAYDLEATQAIDHGPWTWIGSAGLRYMEIVQHYNVFEFRPGIGSGRQFNSAHNFHGLGPTLSLEGRRVIACSGFSFYGNIRESILVGDSLYDASFFPAGGGNPAGATQTLVASWSPVSITELELGVEYALQLGYATGFVRGGVVYQYWQGVGNASYSDPTFTGNFDRGNMALAGVQASAGITY